MIFQKVQAIRIYDEVASQIEAAIISGKLKPGDKLPPEREFIEQFEISRRALREALRILEQKGLIELRRGSRGGAFILGLTPDKAGESLALFIRMRKVSLHDLAEFRLDMEGLIAGRAAENADKRDIATLNELLSEAAAIMAEEDFDWKRFMDVDRRMHIALAHAAKNMIHELILHTVHQNIHTYFESYLPRERKVVESNFQEMAEIVRAVERGDAKKASALGQKHVQRGTRFMKEMADRDSIHLP